MSAPQPGTPLPWGWVSEDHSALILGGDPDYITHCVMWVSPCEACQKRNTTKQWEWGRCTTPSEQDAAYIVHACNNYPKAQALADALRALRNEAWVNLAGGRGDLIDDASAALAAWDAKP